MNRFLISQDFAEFFAELCALDAPVAPITPLYSLENTCAPSITIRLLTEGVVGSSPTWCSHRTMGYAVSRSVIGARARRLCPE
jgi:hypothetical protein